MIWLFVFLAFLLILLMYVTLVPFYLELDSTTNIYRFRIQRLVEAGILFSADEQAVYCKVPGWYKKWTINQLLYRGTGDKTGSKNKKPSKKSTRDAKIPFRKIKALLTSFEITRCYIDIGFNSMSINGMLFPIAILVANKTGYYLRVNFEKRIVVKLTIKNSIAKMAWLYFKA